jgi:hypothetical protein
LNHPWFSYHPRPASYDAELAATLAEIIWNTLYLEPMPPG